MSSHHQQKMQLHPQQTYTPQTPPSHSHPRRDKTIVVGLLWPDEHTGCSYVSVIKPARYVRANLTRETAQNSSHVMSFAQTDFQLTITPN